MTEFDRAVRRATPRPQHRPRNREQPYLAARGILWIIFAAAFFCTGLILAALT